VLVNWTELVRPDGVVIKLDSPAADALGGAGVPGRVNSFFFQRFFNSVLQTALALGGSYATYSSEAPVIVGLPNTAVTTVTSQSSLIGQSPQPRIKVKQGTAFNVFVARDLDFSGAPLRR
jgi:type IV secretion system protein VirB10